MADYFLSNKAVEDLSKIWLYTCDTWSERQADKYYYMLLETCQDLANGDLSGKSYPEINDEVLGFKAGQHVIFFRKSKNNSIQIARILHSQMDLKNKMHD